jgi:hypothetical protein
VLDLASRQVTFVSANGLDGGEVPAVHEKGIVFLPSDRRSLGLLASDVQRSSLVQVPDSMRIAGFALNSAGDSTALLVSTTHGIILAVSPLGAWRARVLHTFAPDEAPRTVTWNSAGVIYFWLWRSGEGGPALWRVRPGGGAPERVGPVPAACNLSEVIVAHAAPRAVCRSEDLRSDIWLMNLPGVTR